MKGKKGRPGVSVAPVAAWLLALSIAVLAVGSATSRAEDEEAPPKKGAYGNTPGELRPFRGLGEPYKRFFTEPPTFRGPGRDDPEPADLTSVPIGALLPRSGPDERLGRNLERGMTLAIEEANAEGGFRPGMPFRSIIRDEAVAWGAAGDAAVDLVSNHGVWGLIGGLEDANSHVLSRILLKLEVPTVNTGGPDPTLTEHMIPWLLRVRPDDRQTGYALAKRMFATDGRTRVAVLRSNDRYGRTGTRELVDAARRLHKPIAVEVRFENNTEDWTAQIDRLRRARADALVLWGRAGPSGRALRAVRAAGIDLPVYGPDRLVDPEFLRAARGTAEGLVFTYPFDRRRAGAAWTGFERRYHVRFGEPPDAVAAYAYDGTRLLLGSIRAAGLNRVRIREHLFAQKLVAGVTGPILFDATRNNVSEVILGHVENGTFHFD